MHTYARTHTYVYTVKTFNVKTHFLENILTKLQAVLLFREYSEGKRCQFNILMLLLEMLLKCSRLQGLQVQSTVDVAIPLLAL